LFYRLNVISLELPALRQRPEDILPIAQQLLATFARSADRRLDGFSARARVAMQRHTWPGNLRELRNCIERAAILCEQQVVDLEDLPNLLGGVAAPVPQVGDFVTLAALEEAHIQRVVERAGSFMQAARLLGINKTTLYRRRRRSDEVRNDEGTLPFDEGLRAAMTG
jgi:NtrC-family two-component system response regulator AlgB